MQTELKLLSKFLQETNIPEDKEIIGFLELIKKPMNETINSQIYAYFLGCKIPEIRTAFMSALMTIIEKKISDSELDKNIILVEPFIYTEIYTASKARIDIVIEDFHTQSAIIIENKINHDVNNPFIEYWEHYNKFPEKNRIGILLTKKPEVIPVEVNKLFINVTHKEWIDNVKSALDLSVLDSKYQLYLSDFFNTIDNFTTSNIMNESASFYFQNAQKITQVLQTRNHAVEYINIQFELVASELGLEISGRDFWRNFKVEQKEIDIYLTVVANELMQGENRIMIILELGKENIDKIKELDIQLKDHPQYESKKKGTVKSNHYAHYLTTVYELTQDEIANLGETIVKYIRQDFISILVKAIKISYQDKDISAWKENLQVVQKDYISE